MRKIEKSTFLQRFSFAFQGISKAFRKDSSLRLQGFCAGGLLLFCLIFRPPIFWCALFAAMASLVIALEMVNSAIEAALDKLHPDFDPQIGFVKDCLAGAVLVASFGALMVFLFYFFS